MSQKSKSKKPERRRQANKPTTMKLSTAIATLLALFPLTQAALGAERKDGELTPRQKAKAAAGRGVGKDWSKSNDENDVGRPVNQVERFDTVAFRPCVHLHTHPLTFFTL
jgi:hypothetical protein